MKKRLLLSTLLFLTPLTYSCDDPNKLLILNWGEYMNEDLIEAFEQEYQVTVSLSVADSNELFYSKVSSGTTAFDLVLPSDYMIEKFYMNDLLQEIDYSKLSNYQEGMFLPGVYGIQSGMFEGNEKYNIPYFWGTFGLMYNKLNAPLMERINANLAIEDASAKDDAMWAMMFEQDATPSNTRIGMYDVPRFAYAASLLYNNMSPNEESDEALQMSEDILSRRDYNQWGTDQLKHNIASDNLDLAFVYTGDFIDTLYVKQEEGYTLENMPIEIYVPNRTIAFMDSFVIPKKARHVDLAHKFIDFFLRAEVAYENASIVGYSTPLIESYNMIVNGEDEEWAKVTSTYYPLPAENDPIKYKGTALRDLSREYLNEISTMVNNIKAQ